MKSGILIRLMVLFFAIFLGTACTKKDPFKALRDNPDVNKTAWYNSMAQMCSESDPRAGCNYRYDGHKIILNEDPNISGFSDFTITSTRYTDFYQVWEEYCASYSQNGFCDYTRHEWVTRYYTNISYTVHAPDGKTYSMSSWEHNQGTYTAQLDGWKITFGQEWYWDSYGYGTHTTGQYSINVAYVTSPTGIKYDYYSGRALNSAELLAHQDDGNDILASVAEQKEDQIRGIAEMLSTKFHLDESVTLQAARGLSDWSEIGATRARSKADYSTFAKKVYGINFAELENLEKLARDGRSQELNQKAAALLNEAASNWKTTPETMKEVLKFFYGNL